MVARTIPPAPFLGRGKIIGGLEGHPPDLLPGAASLCTPALRMAGEYELRAGGHPQTPAKGRRPLHSRFEERCLAGKY